MTHRRSDTTEVQMSEAVGCLLGVAAIGAAGMVALYKKVVEPWVLSLF